MLKYQIVTEIFMMIVFLFFVLEVGLVGNIMRNKIFDSINMFVVYCIQPLFILNGDVNFRDRVLRHGFLNALRTELLFWWILNSCIKWEEVQIKLHTYSGAPLAFKKGGDNVPGTYGARSPLRPIYLSCLSSQLKHCNKVDSLIWWA